MTHYKRVIVIDLGCDHCGVSRLPWQLGCKAWRSNRTLDTFTHTLHTILKLFLPAVSTVSTPFQLRLSPPVYTRSFYSFVLHFSSYWSAPLPTCCFNRFNSISTQTISTSSYAQFQQLRSPFQLRLIFASLCADSTAPTAFQLIVISASSYPLFQPLQLHFNSHWSPPLHEYAQYQPL